MHFVSCLMQSKILLFLVLTRKYWSEAFLEFPLVVNDHINKSGACAIGNMPSATYMYYRVQRFIFFGTVILFQTNYLIVIS